VEAKKCEYGEKDGGGDGCGGPGHRDFNVLWTGGSARDLARGLQGRLNSEQMHTACTDDRTALGRWQLCEMINRLPQQRMGLDGPILIRKEGG